jgi:tetratricopeptide (TPR) repeat protein
MFTTYYRANTKPQAYVFVVLTMMFGLLYSLLPTAALCGQDGEPPRRLPDELMGQATPITEVVNESMIDRLHRGLAELDEGRYDDAISTWQDVAIPCENEMWRHLALGVAHLNSGRLAEAADEMALAEMHDSQNAAVHYFAGVLRMAQAENAGEYSDALLHTDKRLVSYVVGSSANATGSASDLWGPKTRSRYELEAIIEFVTALELAGNLDLESPLVPWDSVVYVPHPLPDVGPPPTIEDLLRVLGADNFEGKANGMLAYLYLDHHRPDEAELHTDSAIEHGIPVPYGYRLIGEQYEELGRNADAYRVYMKAVNEGDGMARPLAAALARECFFH